MTTPPTTVSDPQPDPRVGTVLAGKYHVLRVIDPGVLGTLYLAEDTSTRRQFALKVLRGEYAQVPEVVARFEREASAMQAIAHENVLQPVDFARADGTAFIVLERVEGESLRRVLDARHALPVPLALEIIRQVGAALDRAHSLGIVHRDLKPETVIVWQLDNPRPRVKVFDFGMASVMSGVFAGGRQLTSKGAIIGTPDYMAPEQASGQTVGPEADQYALGVILYEMLAGRRPFVAASSLDVAQMHMFDTPPPLTTVAPWVGAPIAAAVDRMLAKRPEARFPSVLAAVNALLAESRARGPALTGLQPLDLSAPVAASPRKRVMAALVVMVVLATIAVGIASLERGSGGSGGSAGSAGSGDAGTAAR